MTSFSHTWPEMLLAKNQYQMHKPSLGQVILLNTRYNLRQVTHSLDTGPTLEVKCTICFQSK